MQNVANSNAITIHASRRQDADLIHRYFWDGSNNRTAAKAKPILGKSVRSIIDYLNEQTCMPASAYKRLQAHIQKVEARAERVLRE